MKQKWLGRWQANFIAGLVVIMPAVISVAVVLWLFGTAADFTDKLSVADAIKFIISLGTVSPEYAQATGAPTVLPPPGGIAPS